MSRRASRSPGPIVSFARRAARTAAARSRSPRPAAQCAAARLQLARRGAAARRRAAAVLSWTARTTSARLSSTAVPARISHTHGPKRTPGNGNLLARKTVTREARTPTDLTACRMGEIDFQLVAVKEELCRASAQSALRRSPRFAGRCRPPPGELAGGRRSLARASLRLAARAPCASSASAWRLTRRRDQCATCSAEGANAAPGSGDGPRRGTPRAARRDCRQLQIVTRL